MLLGRPDLETISPLNPRAVVAYLRAKGWKKLEDFGENAALFGLEANSNEILVPISSQSRDFGSVMSVLVQDLVEIDPDHPMI